MHVIAQKRFIIIIVVTVVVVVVHGVGNMAFIIFYIKIRLNFNKRKSYIKVAISFDAREMNPQINRNTEKRENERKK